MTPYLKPTIRFLLTTCFIISNLAWAESSDTTFKIGAAKHDVTPKEAVPMWGYGARHDALSTGMQDPLYAAAHDGRV